MLNILPLLASHSVIKNISVSPTVYSIRIMHNHKVWGFAFLSIDMLSPQSVLIHTKMRKALTLSLGLVFLIWFL